MMNQQQIHDKEADLQQVSEKFSVECEKRSSLELALDESELNVCSQTSRAEAAEAAMKAMKDEHEREKMEACRSLAGLRQKLSLQVAENVEAQKQAKHACQEMQRMAERLALLEKAEAKREE